MMRILLDDALCKIVTGTTLFFAVLFDFVVETHSRITVYAQITVSPPIIRIFSCFCDGVSVGDAVNLLQ